MKSPGGDDTAAGQPATARSSANMLDYRDTQANDETYDLDAMDVADGFRPTEHSNPPAVQSDVASTSATMQAIAAHSPSPPPGDDSSKYLPGMVNRPSSLTKAHRPHDSLTLHNDGRHPAGGGPLHGSRSANRASGPPILRIDSPYRGPSGPSHPYGMYLQRTASTATDATQTPISTVETPDSSQSYGPAAGPMHPYALYTQSTTPEDEEQAIQTHIPVGFNGVGSAYRRQIGPDGEESGGLVGPLGHTEELPPYSRYPTEGHSASRPVVATVPSATPSEPLPTTVSPVTPAPVSTSTPAPPAAIAGAGGIGMATRNPEFSSTDEDLSMPYNGPQLDSSSSNMSHHDINMAAKGPDEKTSRRAKWQRRAKKRLFGVVPYWAICLCVCVVACIGIIAGAVMGALLDNETKPKSVWLEPEFLTQLPEGLPNLATGDYALPPLDASQAPRACFDDTTQAQAWSCEVPYRYFTMHVGTITNSTNETSKYQLTLTPLNGTDSEYIWGTQPPTVPTLPLTLVNDTFEPGRGAAWWLKVTYDKTVTVTEDSLSRNTKRDWVYPTGPAIAGFDHTQYRQKNKGAVDGDKPWICTWPDTMLEVFIYPSQNASIPYSSTTVATSPVATDNPWADTSTGPDVLNPYPSVVKFLERRLPAEDGEAAICRQVLVTNNGMDAEPILNRFGNPRQITIREKEDSTTSRRMVKKSVYTPPLNKRDEHSLAARGEVLELTDCGCLWWST
ncbi:hypothetical protein B0I35DRAFT_410982 [Stachybotrys elegans]|uniref:DUF7820 domain-containing protein n=1 Tax=Stachybotrys elegans TaxID=80388 RepID=A0A8K0SMT8_9HYPO|nr:hypothetical protein B0I35DRAFT_410982 [Stachybotrys elegans]